MCVLHIKSFQAELPIIIASWILSMSTSSNPPGSHSNWNLSHKMFFSSAYVFNVARLLKTNSEELGEECNWNEKSTEEGSMNQHLVYSLFLKKYIRMFSIVIHSTFCAASRFICATLNPQKEKTEPKNAEKRQMISVRPSLDIRSRLTTSSWKPSSIHSEDSVRALKLETKVKVPNMTS